MYYYTNETPGKSQPELSRNHSCHLFKQREEILCHPLRDIGRDSIASGKGVHSISCSMLIYPFGKKQIAVRDTKQYHSSFIKALWLSLVISDISLNVLTNTDCEQPSISPVPLTLWARTGHLVSLRLCSHLCSWGCLRVAIEEKWCLETS